MLTLNFMSDIKKCFKHTHHWLAPVYILKMTSPGPEIIIKMYSVRPVNFNAVELCVVTINEKPWTCAREACRALEYKKGRARDVLKKRVSIENKQHKHEREGHSAAARPLEWPKNSQPDDYYINEEGMYELVFGSQRPKAKAFRKHCMPWKLKILQVVSRPLSLQMKKNARPISNKF